MNEVINMNQWLEDNQSIYELGIVGPISHAVYSKKHLLDGKVFIKDDAKYRIKISTKHELISYVNDEITECKRELEDGERKGFLYEADEEEIKLRLSEYQATLNAIETNDPTGKAYYTLSLTRFSKEA